ncbi:hypothetical protein GW915_00190 [bacterium]|nr:hypothetical protein [bacterium]
MQKSFNAGLIFSATRTLAGWIFLTGLWGVWGYSVSGFPLAFGMMSWTLLWGPLFFLALLVFRHPFVGKNVFRLELKRFPVLLKGCFKNILRHPGPDPEFYVMPSRDCCLVWLQSPFSRRQQIYVTSAWVEQGYFDLVSQFTQTWVEISQLTRSMRCLRTFQWAFWCACFLPLDLSLHFLDLCFSFFGFQKIPKAAFWGQRVCWQFKRLWFGVSDESFDDTIFEISRRKASGVRTPAAFDSLIWGVWSRHSLNGVHPSWAILMDSGAFFRSEPT